MDRLLLLSHPPCDTCELQGNDSPGAGMRKCRGFTHPVLLLISSSADSCCSCSIVTRYYKSFSQFPVLVFPVFPVHKFSFPSHSLLLRFNILSFGISLSARSWHSRTCASCGLLCQTEHVLPRWVCRPREHVCVWREHVRHCECSLEWGIFPCQALVWDGCWRLGCGAHKGSRSCLTGHGAELSLFLSVELHKLLIKTLF